MPAELGKQSVMLILLIGTKPMSSLLLVVLTLTLLILIQIVNFSGLGGGNLSVM